MSDLNELLNNISVAQVNREELQRQLDTLSKEYEMECGELRRLQEKNVEYTNALNAQETAKKQQAEAQQMEESKQNLSNFVNELGGIIRW